MGAELVSLAGWWENQCPWCGASLTDQALKQCLVCDREIVYRQLGDAFSGWIPVGVGGVANMAILGASDGGLVGTGIDGSGRWVVVKIIRGSDSHPPVGESFERITAILPAHDPVDAVAEVLVKQERRVRLETDPVAMARIRVAARDACADLVESEEAIINLPFISANERGPLSLKTTITRQQVGFVPDRDMSVHLVRVLSIGQHDRVAWLVREAEPDGSHQGTYHRTICGALPSAEHMARDPREAIATAGRWIRQITYALEVLHRNGVAHGRLHEGNVIVNSNSVVLVDYGLLPLDGSAASVTRDLHDLGTLWGELRTVLVRQGAEVPPQWSHLIAQLQDTASANTVNLTELRRQLETIAKDPDGSGGSSADKLGTKVPSPGVFAPAIQQNPPDPTNPAVDPAVTRHDPGGTSSGPRPGGEVKPGPADSIGPARHEEAAAAAPRWMKVALGCLAVWAVGATIAAVCFAVLRQETERRNGRLEDDRRELTQLKSKYDSLRTDFDKAVKRGTDLADKVDVALKQRRESQTAADAANRELASLREQARQTLEGLQQSQRALQNTPRSGVPAESSVRAPANEKRPLAALSRVRSTTSLTLRDKSELGPWRRGTVIRVGEVKDGSPCYYVKWDGHEYDPADDVDGRWIAPVDPFFRVNDRALAVVDLVGADGTRIPSGTLAVVRKIGAITEGSGQSYIVGWDGIRRPDTDEVSEAFLSSPTSTPVQAR